MWRNHEGRRNGMSERRYLLVPVIWLGALLGALYAFDLFPDWLGRTACAVTVIAWLVLLFWQPVGSDQE